MSLFKSAAGIYHADVRDVGVGRFHGSMRTRKRSEAGPRYDAIRRLFREAKGAAGVERRALIEQLRAGVVTVERLAAMVAAGEPLVPFTPLATGTATAVWPTIDVSIERYIAWMQMNPNKAKATWEHARAALRRFAEHVSTAGRMGDLAVDAVTSDQVEAYQRTLLTGGVSASTASAYIARVGALWAWMQRKETRSAIEDHRAAAIIHSPLDRDVMTRERSKRDRWLTKDEAERLLAATPDRLRFAVAAGLFGGFRIGEILTLRTFVDVDLELGTITIAPKEIGVDEDGKPITWAPKTRRARRVVPIATDLRAILVDHLSRFASDDWVMPSLEDATVPFVYKTFNKHFDRVVLDAELVAGRKDPRGVVFHTLRHTFASWLVQSGTVDLYTVAQLLGDSLQVTEATYAHLSPDFKRRAIDAFKGAIRLPSITAVATHENLPQSATTEAIANA